MRFDRRASPVPPDRPTAALGGDERLGARRALAVTSLVITTVYLVWRATSTITLGTAWIGVPYLALEAATLVSLALFVYSAWRTDAIPPAAPRHHSGRRLAIVIPTYNEDAEVLLPTVTAALAVDLAHDTWILDDGNRPWVAEMAEALGARYLARSTNRHAKAGNLNHALATIPAELFAVLDADHVPRPNLFTATIGYFDDPDVALVQTPQSFYNRDSFEHLGAYEEEAMFYRVLQPAKNAHQAAFWCGTSAVVRAEALRSIRGVAVETLTEDLHTTLRLHRLGWRTVFHDEVVAEGLAPTSYADYSRQRQRWATGAMQILRTERLFTDRGLSGRQKLAYAATLSGWFEPLRTLGYLLVALAVVASGASPVQAPVVLYVVAYGLVLTSQQATVLALSRGRHRLGAGLLFDWYRLSSGLHASRHLLRRGGSLFQVTPTGRTGDERRRGAYPRGLAAVLAAATVGVVWCAATLAGLTPVHYGQLTAVLVAAGFLVLNGAMVATAVLRAGSTRFGSERRAGRRFDELQLPIRVGSSVGELEVPSLTGALLHAPRPVGLIYFPERSQVAFDLVTPRGPVPVWGTISRGSETTLAIEFEPGQWAAMAEIARCLFVHHGGHDDTRLPPRRPLIGA
ncbi:MAG: glycosyltransferase [Acidimicrobiales bacterium]